jgi:hypothetical protein
MLRPLALSAAIALAAPAAAQDVAYEPSFGVVSITSGFQPETNWVHLLAGGANRGEYTDRNLDIRCTGYFADAPDFRVFFTPGTDPLSFYVESGDDTVLLINTPDGDLRVNAVQNEEQRGGQTFSIIPFIDSGDQAQDAGAGLSLVA